MSQTGLSTRVAEDPAAATGAAVDVRGLRKYYGSVHAVDGIDLTIAPGEVVAVLGPNGAGKSTTVDLILGLTEPDSGSVRVFGVPAREAVSRGAISAMLQGGALLDDATVAEMVGMVASLHRRPMPVAKALGRAGIEDLAGRRGSSLSGGQKQRVRFAVALVSDPDLLVLDEPTAAMDVASRREFWRSMHSYTESGRTVLFGTHYLEEAEEFADRVVLMRAGSVVADGSVAQVRALAGGRSLRAVVPGASEQWLRQLPGVSDLQIRGERIALSSTDSDTTLRALLHWFPDAHHIEITAVGLEGAFLSLTSETANGPAEQHEDGGRS